MGQTCTDNVFNFVPTNYQRASFLKNGGHYNQKEPVTFLELANVAECRA